MIQTIKRNTSSGMKYITYSNTGHMIQNTKTNNIYDLAIDVQRSRYIETDTRLSLEAIEQLSAFAIQQFHLDLAIVPDSVVITEEDDDNILSNDEIAAMLEEVM